LATGVRYYWSYRFGKPFFVKRNQCDFPPNQSVDEELGAYESFLATTTALARTTVIGRVREVGRMLHTMFGTSCFSRDRVTVDVVRDYLACSAHLSASTKSRVATDVKSYAGFLVKQGYGRTAWPIVELPMCIRRKTSVGLPGAIGEGDLRVLVDSIDSSCERGARDLGLVLLMGKLGLRVSDVARLELSDIGWADATLAVRSSKSKTVRRLPLDVVCGGALERYVTQFRPMVDTRRVFLVAGGEQGTGPVSVEQAGRAVKLAAEKAGIRDYGGTHTLRRNVATAMVSAGVDIKTVADVLGHENIVTTMGYLRLDLGSLRKAAAEWPTEAVDHG